MKRIANLYKTLPKKHKVVISSTSIFLVLLALLPSEKASASRQVADNRIKIGKRYAIELTENTNDGINQQARITEIQSVDKNNNQVSSGIKNELASAISPKTKTSNITNLTSAKATVHAAGTEENDQKNQKSTLAWQTTSVKNGDSLAKIFKRLGFGSRTTHDVMTAKGKYSASLTKLRVGDKLRYATNDDKKLVALSYQKSRTEIIHIDLINNSFESSLETKEVEIRETFAHGVINSNFWSAGLAAGLNDNQIISLANVFGWDIDFALDIRKGDSFHVVYENRYIDGEYIGTGKILAAEFINQNEAFKAIRFTDDEYYTPEGKSMRKAFLRAPVNFKYISSNFKPKRFHPVQKRWKAHRGTDYAAKTGTPVVAAGNGKVTHSTYNKYNGNYVFIQHGNGIITKYLHFSKKAVKRGQRVKQGQVIGYVGATGLAAGPHLHYEFLLNGVHRNPRTVKLPDSKPLSSKLMANFTQLANLRINELNGSKQALIAMQPTSKNQSE